MRSLEFDPSAFEDLAWWAEHDRGQALRIIRLVRDVLRDQFSGLGKPEPLRHELAGCWSRRISEEHRLVTRFGWISFAYLPAAITTELARCGLVVPEQYESWAEGDALTGQIL